MSKALGAVARMIAAFVKGRRADSTAQPMRRPVDEILDCSYKFAHGPHSTKDCITQSKDAA